MEESEQLSPEGEGATFTNPQLEGEASVLDVEPVETSAYKRPEYEPFDAKAELTRARGLTTEEQQLPAEERAELMSERIHHVTEQLREQHQGISAALHQVYQRIQNAPDSPITDLIDEAAVRLRLSQSQYELFRQAEETYRGQRAINKSTYEAHGGDPAEVYEAVFRAPPKGQVEVDLTYASLHFTCFDPEDYLLGFTGGVSRNPSTEMSQLASGSGGTALTVSNGPAAGYSVTLENAALNSDLKPVKPETVSRRLHYGAYQVDLGEKGVSNFTIEAGGHSLAVKILGGGVQIDREDGTSNFLTRRTSPHDSSFLGYVADSDPSQMVNEFQEVTDSATGSTLVIDGHSITYTDNHPDGAKITSVVTKIPMIRDSQRSYDVWVHEAQHRLNKLFSPIENQVSLQSLTTAAMENTDNPEAAKHRMLYDEVRYARRKLVDPTARDEILAYFQEGKNGDEIFTILTSDLYNYQRRPGAVQQKLKINQDLVNIWQTSLVDLEGNYVGPPFPNDTEMQAAYDQVFGTEYREHLRKWTDVVQILEATGHSRDEVMGMMYQEPASHWVAAAARLEPTLRKALRERAEARAKTP